MDNTEKQLKRYAELMHVLRPYLEQYKYFNKVTGVPIAAALMVVSVQLAECAKAITTEKEY